MKFKKISTHKYNNKITKSNKKVCKFFINNIMRREKN